MPIRQAEETGRRGGPLPEHAHQDGAQSVGADKEAEQRLHVVHDAVRLWHHRS